MIEKPREISVEDAAEVDLGISPHWHSGSVMVLKVCGYDRIGMIQGYVLEGDGRVAVRFLMIDTLLKRMDGRSAYATFGAQCIVRRAESWDVLSIKPLVFPETL